MTEPKPCPFCGCEKIQEWMDGAYSFYGRMVCTDCGSQGPEVNTHLRNAAHWREAAITEWNRRADAPVSR
jgi:Lar family restriction alleviation protein